MAIQQSLAQLWTVTYPCLCMTFAMPPSPSLSYHQKLILAGITTVKQHTVACFPFVVL